MSVPGPMSKASEADAGLCSTKYSPQFTGVRGRCTKGLDYKAAQEGEEAKHLVSHLPG